MACTHDEQGRLLKEARIEANSPEGFKAYFEELKGTNEVVMEACWNWATLYDLTSFAGGLLPVPQNLPRRPAITAKC